MLIHPLPHMTSSFLPSITIALFESWPRPILTHNLGAGDETLNGVVYRDTGGFIVNWNARACNFSTVVTGDCLPTYVLPVSGLTQ
jgi:hypothetical protein